MNTESVDSGVEVHELASWRKYAEWIDKHHANAPALIYRGQADATWLVESSLDRLEKRFPTKKNHSGGVPAYFNCPPVGRDTHLKAYQEAVRNKRGTNPPSLDSFQWWAMGQHHGLATPMLDWTLSPFVALFFAFEERCVVHADGRVHEPENRAVFALSSSCITEHGSSDAPAPSPYSPKGETSSRVGNQGGVFLYMPPRTDLESYVRGAFSSETTTLTNPDPRAILQKFIIPNDDRINCLKLLNKMNVNRMSLFPDLDGAARYINSMWELDFDTSLGFLADSLE